MANEQEKTKSENNRTSNRKFFVCPCCETIVGDCEMQEIYDYCPNCGQAIDWSEL